MIRRFVTVAALSIGLFSRLVSAGDKEVVERFMVLSRDLRTHRSDMLARFSEEIPMSTEAREKGLRVYLRWAPESGENLRGLDVSFEADGVVSREALPVRKERDGGLLWYSVLLKKPPSTTGVLRLRADVESRRFHSPLHSNRSVTSYEGSFPVVLETNTNAVRVVIDLDTGSPFSQRKRTERSLRLSLLSNEKVATEAGAR